jgi:hypothetical protein
MSLTKMLGIGKSEKARFEVRVTGDDDQVFVTELSMSALKNPLRDHLLVPFINQVQHAKGTNIACSHIEVNGSPIETMTDLLRPLSEYVVPGDTTIVQLTLELVEAIKERRETRRREAILDHTTKKGSFSRPKMAMYQVESVESFSDPIGEYSGPQLGTVEAQRSPTSTQAALDSSRLAQLAQLAGRTQSASGNLFFLEKDDEN